MIEAVPIPLQNFLILSSLYNGWSRAGTPECQDK